MAKPRRYAAFDDLTAMSDEEEDSPPPPISMMGAAYSLGLTPAKRRQAYAEPVSDSRATQSQRPRSSGGARAGLGGRPVQSGDPIMFGSIISRHGPYESGLYYK